MTNLAQNTPRTSTTSNLSQQPRKKTRRSPHASMKTPRPLSVLRPSRWKVGGIYATLKPSADGRSVRVYTKDRKDLGKCGVLMKIRWAEPTTASPHLSEMSVNSVLMFMLTHRLHEVVHLDQSECGTIRVSFSPDPSAPAVETVNGNNPTEVVQALDELVRLMTATAEGRVTPELLARLCDDAASRRC